MEKYFTAKSYEGYTVIGKPYKKKGRLYSDATCKCDRCSGLGIIVARVENNQMIPIPVDGGICYKCKGSGKVTKSIRLYTEKEKEILDRAEARRQEQRQAIYEQRMAEIKARAEEIRLEWLSKNGFNKDGFTYCVFGDDTYSIKDQLKEMGCKYHPLLKWHCSEPINVPSGYGLISISFDDILKWDEEANIGLFKEDAKVFIERKFAEAEGPSLSEYVGEIGERLRNLTAVYTSRRGFMGKFGWTNIFTFKVGEDVLVWFTASEPEIEVGSTIDLTGTIVAHEEFRGVKTTKINRCKIVEVK